MKTTRNARSPVRSIVRSVRSLVGGSALLSSHPTATHTALRAAMHHTPRATHHTPQTTRHAPHHASAAPRATPRRRGRRATRHGRRAAASTPRGQTHAIFVPGHTDCNTDTGYDANEQQDTARCGAGHIPLRAGRSLAVNARDIRSLECRGAHGPVRFRCVAVSRPVFISAPETERSSRSPRG